MGGLLKAYRKGNNKHYITTEPEKLHVLKYNGNQKLNVQFIEKSSDVPTLKYI